MTLLLVGGAGYIGSYMSKMLVKAQHDVVVLDNLSTGYQALAKYGRLMVGDIRDSQLLDQVFSQEKFDAVLHFAASSLVGESVMDPAKYYENNVCGTLNLLQAMVRHGVKNIVFSSTAAIFGNPQYTPIDELHPQNPINPYGSSKRMIETILHDFAQAYGLNSVSLRYFNACGADPECEVGEMHEPETHLIPLILQAAIGKREAMTVFGRDYATPDGTCIRDYIHIHDLCSAHSLALQQLQAQTLRGANAFNLGNGNGYSVQEVIEACQLVVEKDGYVVKVQDGERRKGDPAVLIADFAKARQQLQWKPIYSELFSIIEHAWQWQKFKN